MKLILSAITALVLGTAVMTTSASAQPHCWWNGVNHCYYHHGWHHGYWHHGYWRGRGGPYEGYGSSYGPYGGYGRAPEGGYGLGWGR